MILTKPEYKAFSKAFSKDYKNKDKLAFKKQNMRDNRFRNHQKRTLNTSDKRLAF